MSTNKETKDITTGLHCFTCNEMTKKVVTAYDDECLNKKVGVCGTCYWYDACKECGYLCGDSLCKLCKRM